MSSGTKTQELEGFTDSYHAVRLVYWESFDEVHHGHRSREAAKELGKEKKLWLIARMNPKFRDLAAGWYKKESSKTCST